MASMTISTSITKLEPGIGIGLLRPESSGSPNSIFRHSIPITLPLSSPNTLIGRVRKLKIIPSSSA